MHRDQIQALEAAKVKISEIKLDLESLKDDVEGDTDNDYSDDEANAVGEVCSSLDTAEDEIDAAVKLSKENLDKPKDEKEE